MFLRPFVFFAFLSLFLICSVSASGGNQPTVTLQACDSSGNGYLLATLWDTSATAAGPAVCTAGVYNPLPAGWSLADTTIPLIMQQIVAYNWQWTYGLVGANGNGYTAQGGALIGSGMLLVQGSNPATYTTWCASQVLISKPYSCGPPPPPPTAYAPQPTNVLVSGGRAFATWNNWAPSSTVNGACSDTCSIPTATCPVCGSSCSCCGQPPPVLPTMYPPTGWSLATNDAITQAAIDNNLWGAPMRFVLADGSAYWQTPSGVVWQNTNVLFTNTATTPTSYATLCSGQIFLQQAVPSFVNLRGVRYATLSGVGPFDTTATVGTYLPLPYGWQVAPDTAATYAAISIFPWGNVPLVLASGNPYTPGLWGVMAGTYGGLLQTMVDASNTTLYQGAYSNVLIYQPGAAGDVDQWPATVPSYSIPLKTLIIGTSPNDDGITLASNTLNSFNMNFDVFYALSDPNTASNTPFPLYDAHGNPQYSSFVLTAAQPLYYPTNGATCNVNVLPNVLYSDGVTACTGVWGPAVSPQQWNELRRYRMLYGARMVRFDHDPSLTPQFTYTAATYRTTQDAYIAWNAAGVGSYASGLNTNTTTSNVTSANLHLINGQVIQSRITIPKMNSTAGDPYPWAFVVFQGFVTSYSTKYTASANPAVIQSSNRDGTKDLMLMFGQGSWLVASIVDGTMWHQWLNNNVYLGSRIVYMTMQVDDWFLFTQNFTDDPTQTNPDPPQYRATGADLATLQAWQNGIRIKEGQTNTSTNVFTVQFGYNGYGVDSMGGWTQDPLFNATVKQLKYFAWHSHTYDHADLDGMDETDAAAEINLNWPIADQLFLNAGIPLNATRNNQPQFTANCMVTPMITGLHTGTALQGLWDAGIRCTTGDNSRSDLPTPSYLGAYTDVADNGFDGMFIVPRQATDIYYFCADWTCEYLYYNGFYNTSFQTSDGGAAILSMEADRVQRFWMAYRSDPWMFHQLNLATSKLMPSKKTLLSEWGDTMYQSVRQYSTLPITTPPYRNLFQFYLDRRARAAAAITATLNVVNGQGVSVSLNSAAPATALLTSVAGRLQGSSYTAQNFGPDIITNVPVVPGVASVVNLIASANPREQAFVPESEQAPVQDLRSSTALFVSLGVAAVAVVGLVVFVVTHKRNPAPLPPSPRQCL